MTRAGRAHRHRLGPPLAAALGAAAATVLAVALLTAPPSPAQSVDDLALGASINGRALGDIDTDSPLRLVAEGRADVRIEVENRGTADLAVRGVRIDGRVLGLTFFSYEARLDLVVPAGMTEARQFAVDLIDLGGQADGLVPTRLALLDPNRSVLAATDEFPADVRGSLLSVYGLFSLAVAAVTVVLLTTAVIRLSTNRLPADPWGRAARFGLPGLGLGLTVAFILSSLRVLTPTAEMCGRLAAVGGGALFVAGYLAPGPGRAPTRHRPPGTPAPGTGPDAGAGTPPRGGAGVMAGLAGLGRRLRTARPKSSKNRGSPLREASVTRPRR
ncbi:MAG TPA: hypothetical protein VNT56_09785 [Acidimicrobiales bacterium]|nr:hypothetical protein [Acidimicrobiales bacterium]